MVNKYNIFYILYLDRKYKNDRRKKKFNEDFKR